MVALIFGGCGSSSSKDSTGNKATSAPKKLVYFGLNDYDTPDFFTDFEQQNNVTIQKILYPSDKFDQAFMVAMNGGQQVDVGMINGQSVRSYVSKGILADLTNDVTYMDRFYPSSASQYVIGGKLFGLPAVTVWNMCFFYNKDIFTKYKLNPPKTYSDLLSINKVLRKNNIYSIAVGAANSYDLTNWFMENYFQTSGNKGLERTIDTLKGNAKFTDPDYVEAMTDLRNFARDGLFQPGYMGADGTARVAAFASGKTGMYFGGNWDIAGLNKAGLDSSKIGVVNFPVVKQGAQQQVSGTASGSAAVIYAKSAAENKDIDLKLLDYLTSDKMNIKENQKTGTFVSTNKNVTVPGIDPLSKKIQTDLVPTVVTFLDWYWPPEVTKVFAAEMQSVIALQDSPQAAMAKVQKALDDAVAAGYKYQ
jgi:raffinose/stachyose/melibiose transport system substrate-binding protein